MDLLSRLLHTRSHGGACVWWLLRDMLLLPCCSALTSRLLLQSLPCWCLRGGRGVVVRGAVAGVGANCRQFINRLGRDLERVALFLEVSALV